MCEGGVYKGLDMEETLGEGEVRGGGGRGRRLRR